MEDKARGGASDLLIVRDVGKRLINRYDSGRRILRFEKAEMSFHKFMAGVLLVAGVAYLGYLMDIPNMLILGISVVLAICCLLSGL